MCELTLKYHIGMKGAKDLLEPFDYEFACRYQTKTLEASGKLIANLILEVTALTATHVADRGSTFMSELYSDSTNLQNFTSGEIKT